MLGFRRLSSADVAGFKILLALAAMFGLMSYAAHTLIHVRHVTPLAADAPLHRFSEGRALAHVRYLTVDIDGRQEGRPGLEQAANYIKSQLDDLARRAGPDFRVKVEETCSNGSFNMMYLHHSVSLGYKNHKNLLMRISSKTSLDDDPSVLVNGHFDSPLGSPGAGDCGSCVASMLELARLIIDSNWIPPQPIIFLFNGAEELFLLGSHGFMTTHTWSNTVRAFINIEASGTGGLDLVCRSGPGSWPSRAYAKSVKYPMAISVAQAVFGIIPGDTDYRIFAEDYGHIPGLDIIFVLGGYFYHTASDTLERLLPGSIQARGDNLFSLLEAFTKSSKLLSAEQRSVEAAMGVKDEPAVYYDYLSWFMIIYSRKVSLALHSLPLVLYFLMPVLRHSIIVSFAWSTTFSASIKGMLFHLVCLILAIIVPVVFAVVRLLFSSNGMSWFSNPYMAFFMFVPSSLIGLLIPQALRNSFSIAHEMSFSRVSNEDLQMHFWGAFGLYGFITAAYLLVGFDAGFVTLMMSLSMFLAWFSFLASKYFGHQSFKYAIFDFIELFFLSSASWTICICIDKCSRSLVGYVIPLVPCLAYLVYLGGFIVQFVIEKMGMLGSISHPYGYLIPDVIVATIIGMVTGCCIGPLIPVLGWWLARASIMQCLMQVSVLALAISSQFFPYDASAPKRVVLQHTFMTSDTSQIVDSSYDVSVVDANPLTFLFENAPELAKALQIGSDFSPKAFDHSEIYSWVAVYPLSFLFSGSLKFPAQVDDILSHYKYMPHLSIHEPVSETRTGFRRVHLELYLGSLQEIWGTVLNVTGPLSNWSFADNKLPVPDIGGGPPSYICRLSGKVHENWTFWLEANSSEALRVDVAVLDQYLVHGMKKLKSHFPSWVDVTAFSTFFSTYYF